ncbi:MAG: acetate/propionate family kinase [Polyangiaceae bacterium]
MKVLVLNCGSSSVKAAILDAETGARAARALVERIGEASPAVKFDDEPEVACAAPNHRAALELVLPRLIEHAGGLSAIGAVGHRVVHGGERFREPTRIDDEVERTIEELIPLAPLHNPANLAGIRAARAVLSELEQVAVFDTAFHATLPNRAKNYAIDGEIAAKHGIRRYGFHGTSHAYVASRAATFLNEKLRDLRIITCHLGNGASVCAVEYGRSVETSMGMTPLEGLVMGTRSGDLDAGAILHLARAGMSISELDTLLNKRSGLKGLSGVGNDMRDIEARAAEGDERCRLAIVVFAHRVRKYVGAYAAVMGGVDAVVFTGGIGQNSALVRHHVMRSMQFLGADLDEDKNRDARANSDKPVIRISSERSRTQILAVATDEEHAIAEQTAQIAVGRDRVGAKRPIPIAVSARHIHLTTKTVAALFGEGHELTPRNPLSQPGQFACEETLDVVGPKRTLKGVRVLGPVRPADQVEISRTDEFFLGIDAPVRDSGDVRGSPGITLVGPKGQVALAEGVICARRHIHMAPDDATHFGVADGDVVQVAVDSAGRDLTFGDVLIRVSPKFRLEMHVDTDEANAAELVPGVEGMLETTQGTARLVRRNL